MRPFLEIQIKNIQQRIIIEVAEISVRHSTQRAVTPRTITKQQELFDRSTENSRVVYG
jgi:hypothetical protein